MKKLSLILALLMGCLACKVSDYDPEQTYYNPDQPNPTPDTVYEPIDLLLLTRGQMTTDFFNLPYPIKSYEWYENYNVYEIIIYAIIKKNSPFVIDNYNVNIYVWFESAEGNNKIAYPQILNTDYYFIPRVYPAYYPGYMEDYAMSFYLWFKDSGQHDLYCKIYDPNTKKYYISKNFRLEFGITERDYITPIN